MRARMVRLAVVAVFGYAPNAFAAEPSRVVIAGPVPAIHVFACIETDRRGGPGLRPGMTVADKLLGLPGPISYRSPMKHIPMREALSMG
jgi:hypothetical protein